MSGKSYLRNQTYFKPNYFEALKYILPSYLYEDDITGTPKADDVADVVVNSHLDIANNISSILHVSAVEGTAYSSIDALAGISNFFVKQNELTNITTQEFESDILYYFNKTFKEFVTPESFESFTQGTLLPAIDLNNPDSTYFGAIGDSSAIHNYLINKISWLYFLNTTGTLYDPSAYVKGLLVSNLYEGKSISLNDGIKGLSEHVWRNNLGQYYPSSLFASGSVSHLSGTQQLDKLQTWIDVIYSPLYADRSDFTVRDKFETFVENSMKFTDKVESGPFARLIRALSFLAFDINNQTEEIASLYDIDDCPDDYLPLIAQLIGWDLFGSDANKWRLQLRNAVSIYKTIGTKKSIQTSINTIFPKDTFPIESRITEMWESYVPYLIYYALATESDYFKSFESWNHGLAMSMGVGSYSPDSIDDNIRLAVDRIIFEIYEFFPENFSMFRRLQQASIDAALTIYEGEERDLLLLVEEGFFPEGVLERLDILQGWIGDLKSVSPSEEILNQVTEAYPQKFSYRGRDYLIPPFEEYPYYVNVELSQPMVEFLADRLACFGVRQQFALDVSSYITTNALNMDDEPRAGSWLIFTSGYNSPPNLDNLIRNLNDNRFDYASLWSGKSSHFKLVLDASEFDFTKTGLSDIAGGDAVTLVADAIRKNAPAHAIPLLSLELSGEPDALRFDGNLLPLVYMDRTEIDAGAGSNTLTSGIDFNSYKRGINPGGNVIGRSATQTLVSPEFLSASTAPLVARNSARRRSYEKVMPFNGYYDRTGFNMPVGLSMDPAFSGISLGYVPSSCSFTPVTSHINLPAIWAQCEGLNSNNSYYEYDVSNTSPSRSSPSTSSVKTSLVIMAGQSNMNGQGIGAKEITTNVNYWNVETSSFSTVYDPNKNSCVAGVSSYDDNCWGPDAKFIELLSQKDNIENTYIFKYADDSSYVIDTSASHLGNVSTVPFTLGLTALTPRESNTWCPSSSRDSTWDKFEGHLDLVIDSLGGSGSIGNVYFIWNQGETEAGRGQDADFIANQYQGATELFMDTVKAKFSSDVTYRPLRVKINKYMSSGSTSDWTYWASGLYEGSSVSGDLAGAYGNTFSIDASNPGSYGNWSWSSIETVRSAQDAMDSSYGTLLNVDDIIPTSDDPDGPGLSAFTNDYAITDAGLSATYYYSLSTPGAYPLQNIHYVLDQVDSLGERLFSTWANETGVLRESDPTFLKSDRGQLPGIYAAMHRIKENQKDLKTYLVSGPLAIQRQIDAGLALSGGSPHVLGDWTQVTTASSPGVRRAHAMAYDSARGKLVVFGGLDSYYLNDTWEYDGVNWTQVLTANSPSIRKSHKMIYDSVRGKVVLFGGRGLGSPYSYSPNVRKNDTWEYDGVNWTEITPASIPPAREGHTLAYDSARQKVVMFGGFDSVYSVTYFNDTWEYDGVNWTNVTAAGIPAARTQHAMVYDSVRGKVVMFGGYRPSPNSPNQLGGTVNDTWEYDGVNWTQVAFPGGSPSGRINHAMVYDSARQKVVMFGGDDGSQVNDTWEYDGVNWTQVTLTNSPSIRAAHAMVYDSVRGMAVLFGGRVVAPAYSLLNDTWELVLAVPAVPAVPLLNPSSITYLQDLLVNQTSGILKAYTNGFSNSSIEGYAFPSSQEDYYNFEFGRDLHRFYHEYKNNFQWHRLSPDVQEQDGANIFSHTLGPLLYNHNFDKLGSVKGLVASSFASPEKITEISAPFTGTGSFVASAADSMYLDTYERVSSGIIDGVELVLTSGTDADSSFSIIKVPGSQRAFYEDPFLFDKTLLLMRSGVGAATRVRFDLSKYAAVSPHPIATNFLSPEHDFKVNLNSIISRDSGTTLGGRNVNVWIHTKPESGKMWSFTPGGKWVQHDQLASRVDVFLKYAHSKKLTAKQNDPQSTNTPGPELECIDQAGTSRTSPVIGLGEDDFESFEVTFHTRNRELRLPKDYQSSHGQLHRLNQNYVIEVFMAPGALSDEFMLVNKVWVQDLTLKTLSEIFAAGTLSDPLCQLSYFKYGCEEYRVPLSKQDLFDVLKHFNNISGKNAVTGLASRDKTKTQTIMESEGGSRIDYRHTKSMVDTTVSGSAELYDTITFTP